MNILIVEARYHPAVSDMLVAGAMAALEKGGARFQRIAVPGVLELPPAIAIAAQAEEPFDGYVALGAVIGGEAMHSTMHQQSTHGLMTLGLAGHAIGNGIVLAAGEADASLLAGAADAGGDAARAALALVMLRDRLGYLR